MPRSLDARLSHVRGADAPPLLDVTICEALDAAAMRWGEADALISCAQQIRWSWASFAARVDALAAGFLALGLSPGDRIGIWSPNSAEWVLTQFAAAKVGLILVTINPAYRLADREVEERRRRSASHVTEALVERLGHRASFETPARGLLRMTRNGVLQQSW